MNVSVAAVVAKIRSDPRVDGAIAWAFERKRQLLVATQWVMLGLGLGFCITTFDAAGKILNQNIKITVDGQERDAAAAAVAAVDEHVAGGTVKAA